MTDCSHSDCPMTDTVHAEVFNGSMKSIYRELGEIKALLEKREVSRENDVRMFTAMEARINFLMDKQATLSKVSATLFGGVGVLFLWRLIETMGKR